MRARPVQDTAQDGAVACRPFIGRGVRNEELPQQRVDGRSFFQSPDPGSAKHVLIDRDRQIGHRNSVTRDPCYTDPV